jgi:hypothetical protein
MNEWLVVLCMIVLFVLVAIAIIGVSVGLWTVVHFFTNGFARRTRRDGPERA